MPVIFTGPLIWKACTACTRCWPPSSRLAERRSSPALVLQGAPVVLGIAAAQEGDGHRVLAGGGVEVDVVQAAVDPGDRVIELLVDGLVVFLAAELRCARIPCRPAAR